MKTIKEMLLGNPSENLIKESRRIFQIEEFEGKLYLTFNGALVCHTDMFSKEALETLAEIRNLYVERNTISHD